MAKFGRYRVSRNKQTSLMGFVSKLLITIAALYAGGLALTAFGDVMNGTSSPFYDGLTLIGWTVSDTDVCDGGATVVENCITDTTGTGLLVVVGILAILYVVLSMFSIKRY